jgi:signal transduction histidine kinase
VQPHATRKDIEITESVVDPLAPVLGDEGSLTEAFVNLVGNAIKYSQLGAKVFVKASTEADRVMITVADNGVGIAPEDLPFVFDGFYRGKAASTETGVGLGLTLTRRIIQAHNGTISVESQLGKGTTFVISLPAHAARSHSLPANAAAAPSTSGSGDTP